MFELKKTEIKLAAVNATLEELGIECEHDEIEEKIAKILKHWSELVLDCQCPNCGNDIPDVPACPWCGVVFDEGYVEEEKASPPKKDVTTFCEERKEEVKHRNRVERKKGRYNFDDAAEHIREHIISAGVQEKKRKWHYSYFLHKEFIFRIWKATASYNFHVALETLEDTMGVYKRYSEHKKKTQKLFRITGEAKLISLEQVMEFVKLIVDCAKEEIKYKPDVFDKK